MTEQRRPPVSVLHNYLLDREPADLTAPRHFYVLGVSSPGMAPLVSVLLEMGHRVTSGPADDQADVIGTLKQQGLIVDPVGQLPSDLEMLVCSSGVADDSHTLVEAAKTKGMRVVGRAPIVSAVAHEHRLAVGIAGTSGKTTTTTMTTTVLEAAFSPSHLIAAKIPDRGLGGRFGEGDVLVVEAHEDDGTVSAAQWDALVITNIDQDHAFLFGGINGLYNEFVEALQRTPGLRLICADDAAAMKVARSAGVSFETYGTSVNADWTVVNIRHKASSTTFDLRRRGDQTTVVIDVTVPLPGTNAARNAAAALIVGNHLGIPFDRGAAKIKSFRAPERRFQSHGKHDGITLIYDFANIPKEIESSLEAISHGRAAGEWNRAVIVVATGNSDNNPQWLTRIDDYATALKPSDKIVLTDARYEPGPGPVCIDLFEALDRQGSDVTFVARDQLALELTTEILRPGDLCLVMGGLIADLPLQITQAWQ